VAVGADTRRNYPATKLTRSQGLFRLIHGTSGAKDGLGWRRRVLGGRSFLR
jgi:hypothetical protein